MLTHLQFEIQLGQWRNKLINLINAMVQYQPQEVNSILNGIRGGSRTVATSKMERFVIIVNGWKQNGYYLKALHLGCCSSSKSASGNVTRIHVRTIKH